MGKIKGSFAYLFYCFYAVAGLGCELLILTPFFSQFFLKSC